MYKSSTKIRKFYERLNIFDARKCLSFENCLNFFGIHFDSVSFYDQFRKKIRVREIRFCLCSIVNLFFVIFLTLIVRVFYIQKNVVINQNVICVCRYKHVDIIFQNVIYCEDIQPHPHVLALLGLASALGRPVYLKEGDLILVGNHY